MTQEQHNAAAKIQAFRKGQKTREDIMDSGFWHKREDEIAAERAARAAGQHTNNDELAEMTEAVAELD